MNTYDAERGPAGDAWLNLDEATRIDLVVRYHRRIHQATPRVRLHATFHTIVENQLAQNVPVVVEALKRLQHEGLSRHDAVHAIGSVLAAQVFDVLKGETPRPGGDVNEAYARELRQLTAESWYKSGWPRTRPRSTPRPGCVGRGRNAPARGEAAPGAGRPL